MNSKNIQTIIESKYNDIVDNYEIKKQKNPNQIYILGGKRAVYVYAYLFSNYLFKHQRFEEYTEYINHLKNFVPNSFQLYAISNSPSQIKKIKQNEKNTNQIKNGNPKTFIRSMTYSYSSVNGHTKTKETNYQSSNGKEHYYEFEQENNNNLYSNENPKYLVTIEDNICLIDLNRLYEKFRNKDDVLNLLEPILKEENYFNENFIINL